MNAPKITAYIVGGVIGLSLIYWGYKKLFPRGVRNNNPFNIIKTPTNVSGDGAWDGLSAVQADKKFLQFVNAEYGIRAGLKLVRNYITNHGIKTLRAFFTRYLGEDGQRDPQGIIAYASAVSKFVGKGIDAPLSVDDVYNIGKGIVSFENSGYQYPDNVMTAGYTLSVTAA